MKPAARKPSRIQTSSSWADSILKFCFFGMLLAGALVLGAALINMPDSLRMLREPPDESVFTDVRSSSYIRKSVTFNSGSTSLHAWVFLPAVDDVAVPKSRVVIMAGGLGMQKDFGLQSVCQYFLNAGFGCFLFDYKSFGASDGHIRHVVSVSSQLQDLTAALDFVIDSLPGVDSTKVGLWGFSLGGAHVLTLAATYSRKERIGAAVVVAPMVDAFAVGKDRMGKLPAVVFLNAFGMGARDLIRRALGFSAQYIPIAPPANSQQRAQLIAEPVALFPSEQGARYILELVPSTRSCGWRNMLAAGSVLDMLMYRPVKHLRYVTAPTLALVADRDDQVPAESAAAALSALASPSVVKRFSGWDHFDPLLTHIHAASSAATEWFSRYLKRQVVDDGDTVLATG